MLKLVVFSEIKWSYLKTRKQQIISRFPKDWHILFIEPFVLGRHNQFLPKKTQNVIHATVPFFKIVPEGVVRRTLDERIARGIISTLVFLWVKVIFLLTGFTGKKRVFFVSNIYYSYVVQRLPKALVLYDCNDNSLAFSGTPEWAEGYFHKLCQVSDVIICCSSGLAEKIDPHQRQKTVLIGNGVDFDLFEREVAHDEAASELNCIPRPIIAYVGAISEWMDFRLLAKIASAYPYASMVLIGPVTPRVSDKAQKLKEYPNIFLLGAKVHDVLPSYLKKAKVCIIPFVKNELTASVNPNKLYEYVAVGKPVVTLDFSPEVCQYSEIIYVAYDHEDFTKKVGVALSKEHDAEKLKFIARANDWKQKAEQMVDIIKERLVDKKDRS